MIEMGIPELAGSGIFIEGEYDSRYERAGMTMSEGT